MVYRPDQPQNRPAHAPESYYICGQMPKGKRQKVGGLTTIFHEPAACEAATATLRAAIEVLLKQEGRKPKSVIMGDIPALVYVAVRKCDTALLEKIKALPEVKSVKPMGVMYPAQSHKPGGPV
ncbi:MAG: hypothetical protein HYS17_11985 [Micavibrio aeruginosavorus]|uniref:Uncharacterized protein n=1 Tax=Micavibrio aeruginosavorus TaxID=349221 RepID=A0A7T5R268_9BACT|nr:MAG: hypothetical protein HYS17_11985 [Micavibrio aeruginosavorus]